jgi:hypothetical protein
MLPKEEKTDMSDGNDTEFLELWMEKRGVIDRLEECCAPSVPKV